MGFAAGGPAEGPVELMIAVSVLVVPEGFAGEEGEEVANCGMDGDDARGDGGSVGVAVCGPVTGGEDDGGEEGKGEVG